MLLLVIFLFISVGCSVDYLQESIEELLSDELREYRKIPPVTSSDSYIGRRCFDFMACENPIPAIEMRNVVFMNGAVSLVQSSSGSSTRISDEDLGKLYAGKKGHLPAMMAHVGEGSYDLIAGPQVKNEILPESVCQGKWQNSSIFFHFPWELSNTYHCFNDNTLAVLTHTLLQSLLQPSANSVSSREVYLFRDVIGRGSNSLFYKLLFSIFREDHVLPARNILTKGPHCIRHAIFGPPFKVYQKASLYLLRMKVYQLLKMIGMRIVNHHTLSLQQSLPQSQSLSQSQHQTTTPLLLDYHPASPSSSSSSSSSSDSLSQPKSDRAPRVVILTRRSTPPLHSANRKLSAKTEEELSLVFREYGATVTICCDFKVINSVEKMIEVFWGVDICVSIHGAQFSNCIFGSPGMIVFEFATPHGYGCDVYLKLAFMTFGHYIFYDLRRAEKSTALPGPGSVLSTAILHDVVQLCIATWRYSVNVTLPRIEKKMHYLSTRPDQTALYEEFNRAHDSYVRPAAPSLMPQVMYPKHAKKVHERLSSSEVIIRFDKGEAFVDIAKYGKQHSVFFNEYLTFDKDSNKMKMNSQSKKRGSGVESWQLKDHKKHIQYENIRKMHDELDVNPDLINFHKQKKRPRKDFMKVEGVEPYSMPANHREYAIFFHPLAMDDDLSTLRKEHLLGPVVGEDSYLHCTSLPNFKYRIMTQDLQEHRGECDLPIIRMKRSGGNDNKLLGDFL